VPLPLGLATARKRDASRNSGSAPNKAATGVDFSSKAAIVLCATALVISIHQLSK